MLDVYTEGPNSAMSDSAKFKEGYKKKGKRNRKLLPRKWRLKMTRENKKNRGEGVLGRRGGDSGTSWRWSRCLSLRKVKQEMRREGKEERKRAGEIQGHDREITESGKFSIF